MNALAPVLEMPKTPKTKTETKKRRERGEGRVFQPSHKGKKSKFWWIQFYQHGKQIRESSKSNDEKFAKKLLRKRIGEVAAGVLRPPRIERLKYDDLRVALVSNYIAKERKWLRTGKDGERYISHLTALNKFFDGYQATAITSDKIDEFIRTQKGNGLANATVNRSLSLLRRMFKLATKQKKLRTDDVPNIEMLKEPKARQGFLKYDEFLKLRAELPEAIRPVVTMAFFTGMRVGEILALRWTDVSLPDAQAYLRETKNGEQRTVPLSRELLEILKVERQKNPGAEFVFTRNGRRVRDFRDAWRNACVKAGQASFEPVPDPKDGQKTILRYRGLIFHDLRRSGVRNLDRAGVSRAVAMQISGHKTESVYRRYNIVSADDLQLATTKLESYLSKGAVSGRNEEIQSDAQDSSSTERHSN